MHFLVVDDDMTICRGTARRLENMNHPSISEVAIAASGEEALAYIAVHLVDALFTDIRMLGIDGLELIQKAKIHNPALLCVVISAYDDFAYAKQAIRLGVEEFLVKPCSQEDMMAATLNVIARYEEETAHRRLQLDAVLDEMLADKPGDLRALFHAYRMPIPSAPLRVIYWGKKQAKWPETVWMYPLRRSSAGLCALSGDIVGELTASCVEAGISIGVSSPDLPIAEMLSQAQEAWETAWFWEMPKVIPWHAYTMPDNKAAEDRLMNDIRLFQADAVRNGLYTLVAQAADSAAWVLKDLLPRLYATLQEACRQNELTAPSFTAPVGPLGWRHIVDALISEINALHAALVEQSMVNPVPFAKRYMREHLHESLSMGTIANLLDMSYSHFSRLFHERTGETFQEHLLNLRMKEACRMLYEGLRINDIADALGYQNANNFTRSFTKYHGISPSRWRQMQAPDAK